MRIIIPHFEEDTSSYLQLLVASCGERVQVIDEPAGVGLARLYAAPATPG
jgi:hypothetical protein